MTHYTIVGCLVTGQRLNLSSSRATARSNDSLLKLSSPPINDMYLARVSHLWKRSSSVLTSP